MSAHSHTAVTSGECALCGGPCREPFKLAPVAANYPFMSPEHIAATWPEQPPAEPATATRARRLRNDRMRRPEHHDRPREDR